MQSWKKDEWFGEIFYYFLGFPWNKFLWVVGKKNFPWKIGKRWRTSKSLYLSFFFIGKYSNSSVINHFPTFYQTDPNNSFLILSLSTAQLQAFVRMLV